MHTKSDNIEIIMGRETNDVIEELRESLLQNYHNNLKESMRGIEFVPSGIDLFYYHLQRISLNRMGSSYIDSPKWLKNKKVTINPKNNDNNCFQRALTTALNHKKIKNHLERISNLKLFIDQHKWKGINFPLQKEDWKKFKSNNKSIALKKKNSKNTKKYVMIMIIVMQKCLVKTTKY